LESPNPDWGCAMASINNVSPIILKAGIAEANLVRHDVPILSTNSISENGIDGGLIW